jgi:two-component system, response regulator
LQIAEVMDKNSSLQILLVEDNPDDVELALHAFEEFKLANRVQVVRDGAEAIDFLFCKGAYAQRDPTDWPKVVLLDLKLPKIDGLEVLRQIRENPKTRFLPVVILTSSREERDIVEGYRLGVNSFIQKPVDFEQFTAAIRTLGLYWLIMNRPPQPAAA